MGIVIEIDTTPLTEKLNGDKLNQAKELGMDYASQEMVRVLMANSPVDHGLLKQWFVSSISADEAHIRTPAYYAKWVNDGTGPYTITPVNAKALYWDGASHPVKVVHHPGIQGRHFVEDSIEDVSGRLDGYFLKAMQEVLG